MPGNLLVDGALVQWGDRLFYPSNRIVHTPGRALSGSLVHNRARELRQRLHATVVRGAPQVMVKVTGGGRGMGAIVAHFRYISKNGRLPIEDDRGKVRDGKESLGALADQWRHAGSQIPERSARREAFNLMLSMPAGTSEAALKIAAREFAKVELSNHRYVMVLHTHQSNPHVHLSVRAEGKDGKRLNPRKADLRHWREVFAEKLREIGIEAEASPQITRGGSRRTERLWQRKSRDDGRRLGPREGERSDPKLTRPRRDAAKAWCEIAKVLGSSDDIEDRELSRSIVDYARWLPGVRYKPPEQQAQREIQGMDRGANNEHERQRQRQEPQVQHRTPPEFDWGR